MSAPLPQAAAAAGGAPSSGVARRTEFGVIRATGLDAAAFLHGQLTQDVNGLPDGQARLAGYCSAKGRLLASFVVLRPAPEELLLVCRADLLAATARRLSMFVLRARCQLADVSADWSVWSALGAESAAALGFRPGDGDWSVRHDGDPPAWHAVRVPSADGEPRCLVLARGADRPAALASVPTADALAWPLADLRAGIPWVEAATVERFVPQMVNLELVGGVNFQKGCYPGQEVVARSQYRGTLKRRMLLFRMAAPAAAGDEVFHSDDATQPAGQVVNAAPVGAATTLALVEVKTAALARGSLHLGAPGGAPLEREPLPYPVPVEAGDGTAAA